jgi:predicted HTH domain antitoxin
MNRELTQRIAAEVQIFQDLEQKENFLFVLGALLARVISLKKAAEIMEMEPETFLKILDLIGFEFSYLTEEDVAIEQNWE